MLPRPPLPCVASQVAGASLGFIFCHCQEGSPPTASLSLDGRQHLLPAGGGGLGSLPALLAALLPADAALRCLQLHGCVLEANEVACAAPLLARLAELRLSGCSFGGGGGDGGGGGGGGGGEDEAPALAALLDAAPQLTDLHLSSLPGGAVPRCVARCHSLRRLGLCGCGITDIPPGPYLAGTVLCCHAWLYYDWGCAGL